MAYTTKAVACSRLINPFVPLRTGAVPGVHAVTGEEAIKFVASEVRAKHRDTNSKNGTNHRIRFTPIVTKDTGQLGPNSNGDASSGIRLPSPRCSLGE
jgi:hypothetical protein